MELQWRLTHIWMFLWNHLSHQTSSSGNSESKHTDRLKNILMYIQEHYAEKITLADIAATANICQSECCRFFKKHMNESLFDYLLSFRIEKSLPLLVDQQLSITEISNLCGFSSSSYYTKVFREHMGCTPTAYQAGHFV